MRARKGKWRISSVQMRKVPASGSGTGEIGPNTRTIHSGLPIPGGNIRRLRTDVSGDRGGEECKVGRCHEWRLGYHAKPGSHYAHLGAVPPRYQPIPAPPPPRSLYNPVERLPPHRPTAAPRHRHTALLMPQMRGEGAGRESKGREGKGPEGNHGVA